MPEYFLDYKDLNKHLLNIIYSTNVINDHTEIYLPLWRPGRYELGNFAKNIVSFTCYNEKQELLTFVKTEKSKWLVNTTNVKNLQVKYTYYANELNAGSTFIDELQLYVNPVNCFVYNPLDINAEQKLTLQIPASFDVATTLKRIDKNVFKANNLDVLLDNPFIASSSLQCKDFVFEGVLFKLYFQGICKPDWPKLINDFFIFINESVNVFGKFTCEEYHFLFQITPYKHYHGVEHLTNTVIALGPGYDIMNKPLYNELLGVSCHELFHSWNIKSIRPIEMYPYNYQAENYTTLGFVAEGVTTYYGDYLLLRSGVFSFEEWQNTFNEQLNKHFNNNARYNMTVAASSWDTWLDGYIAGVPDRKVSIYTEGCLLAFMIDTHIRNKTVNKNSLDNVMKCLFNDFALQNKGYSFNDYKILCEEISNDDLTDFFANYVFGTTDYTDILKQSLKYYGLTIILNVTELPYETYLGIKIAEMQNKQVVTHVYKNSVACKAGLAVGDVILSINNIAADFSIGKWLAYFNYKQIDLMVSKNGLIQTVFVSSIENETYYKNYQVIKLKKPTEEEKQNFANWAKQQF